METDIKEATRYEITKCFTETGKTYQYNFINKLIKEEILKKEREMMWQSKKIPLYSIDKGKLWEEICKTRLVNQFINILEKRKDVVFINLRKFW